MYKILFIIFLALPLVSNAEKLITKTFIITITSNCDEYSVTCDNVTYKSRNKKNGKTLTLKGKTIHSTCKDGVTPCAFLGYSFQRKNIDYIVNFNGTLEVYDRLNDKDLLLEKGEWQN